MANYDVLAEIYDAKWGFFARRVQPVLDQHLFSCLDEGARILDLCCGTGGVSRILHNRGYTVTGMDASEEMLRAAREKVPGVEFIRADARSFAVTQRFDAVISTFDSLNHLVTLDDFGQMANAVYRALRPGGTFLFDLNMEEGFQQRWRGSTSAVNNDAAWILHSHYDAVSRMETIDVTYFARIGEGSWRRRDLALTQRCYDEAEIVGQLRNAGFSSIDAFAAPAEMRQVGRTFFHGRTGSARGT